jgi:hypothetical protein
VAPDEVNEQRYSPELGAVVEALVRPRTIKRDRLTEAGTIITERIEIASVLDELADSVGSSIDGGGKAPGRASGSVLNLRALDLLDRIRVGVADWGDAWIRAAETPVVGYSHPERRRARREPDVRRTLRRLVARGWVGHERERDQLARLVERWTNEARGLLDGERDYRTVRGVECPECLASVYWERNDCGEVVRGWPLAVDLRERWVRGITCRLCGAYWWRSREDLAGLAWAMGTPVDRVIDALSAYETVERAVSVA